MLDTTDIGPLASEQQRDDVEQLVADAVAEGAKVLCGGAAPEGPGFYYPPTVLAGITSEMRAPTPRKSSAPWPPSTGSATSTRRSSWPTAPSSASARTPGPATSRNGRGSSGTWPPAWCSSMATSPPTRSCRSAVSRTPVSGASLYYQGVPRVLQHEDRLDRPAAPADAPAAPVLSRPGRAPSVPGPGVAPARVSARLPFLLVHRRQGAAHVAGSDAERPHLANDRSRDDPAVGRNRQRPVKRASRRSVKLCRPSAASSLARSPGSNDAMQSPAASGPWPSPARALASVACTPRGACRATSWASSLARPTCAPGRHDLLHQSDPQCLGGTELLRGEQEAHRVTPAELRGHPNVPPPNGMIPRPISSWRKRTSSAAITMSAARASSIDRVNAMPLTAMTTGLGAGSRHTANGSKRCEPHGASGPRSATAGPTSARSRPAEK